MGGVVTIGLLMMTSGAMPKGLWISFGAWELAGAWLDVSPGPEVLTLFGGTRCIDGFEGGEIGGLHVEYRRWGGLEGTPLSEDGTVRAWEAWDGYWGVETLGRASRDADGSVWPPLVRTIADMDKRQIALLLLGGRGAWIGEKFASQGGSELFATEDACAKWWAGGL